MRIDGWVTRERQDVTAPQIIRDPNDLSSRGCRSPSRPVHGIYGKVGNLALAAPYSGFS
jgi:hypothetical protein